MTLSTVQLEILIESKLGKDCSKRFSRAFQAPKDSNLSIGRPDTVFVIASARSLFNSGHQHEARLILWELLAHTSVLESRQRNAILDDSSLTIFCMCHLSKSCRSLALTCSTKRDSECHCVCVLCKAVQGDALSQKHAGVFFEQGFDVPMNFDAAKFWYRCAGAQGCVSAQYNIGRLLVCSNNASEEDVVEALQWWSLASDNGNADASMGMGWIFSQGGIDGVHIEQDIPAALTYFERAANLDHPESLCALASIYWEGKYVPRDADKMIEYYTRASDLGHAASQLALAGCYRHGIGSLCRNRRREKELLEKSASAGNVTAQRRLGQLLTSDPSLQDEAKMWLSKAASHADKDAVLALGDLHYQQGNVLLAYQYYARVPFPRAKEAMRKMRKEHPQLEGTVASLRRKFMSMSKKYSY